MAWMQILVVAVIIWAIAQLIVACFLRLYGNGVLIDPQLQSRKNLSGYYAIVTGSNSGIGYEVVKYLVNHGAHCIMACRDEKRGKFAEQSINAQVKRDAVYKGGNAEFMRCDLSNLASTKQFIADYKAKKYPLHILINNAGTGSKSKPTFSETGFELVFQINYLAHFLITHELLPLMIRSSSTDDRFDCRIVNTSSIWHRHGVIDFEALLGDKQTQIRLYQPGRTYYGRSKLAQIMHATYMQKQVLSPNNIRIAMMSVHPGGVRTDIFQTSKWPLYMKAVLWLLYPAWYYGMRSCEQGARTSIYCAVAPLDSTRQQQWGGYMVPGAYHENMRAASTADALRQSTDDAAMQRLYQVSMDLLQLTARTKRDYQQWTVTKQAAITDDIDDDDDADNDGSSSIEYNGGALENGVVVLTDKAYWFYSIVDTEWRKLCALRQEQKVFDGPSIVYHDDTLYRIGGRNMASDRGMKYGEYLQLRNGHGGGKWHTLTGALNVERCSASAMFVRDHLLMIGGDCNGDELASVEEYKQDSWRLKASSMNKTRNDFGVCCIGSSDKLLVFGGHSVDEQSGISGFLDCVEQYDYTRDEWTLLNTAMPFGRRSRCGAFYWDACNAVVIAGGTQPARNVVECLDLEKLSWTRLPDLTQTKWWSKIGTLSNESPKVLYCIGLNEENKMSVVEQLDTRENSQQWQTKGIAAPFNDKVYATCWA